MTGNIMRDVRIADECPGIECRFRLTGDGPYKGNEVLIVSFSGSYRDGSSGKSDAAYMDNMIAMGCGLWWHTGVVIDLSGLRYHWGDDIHRVLFRQDDIPIAVVVGADCRQALASLIFGLYTEEDITSHEEFFDDLEQAISFVRIEAETRRASYK